MELINRSRLPVEVFTALDKAGRERLVILAKATYRFGTGAPPALSEVHAPIAVTDVIGEPPALSVPFYESDLVPFKRRCDVVLDATAHAPGDRPVTELPVGVRVGALSKQFLAVGERVWKRGALTVGSSRPQPFTTMPLHYGRAFGGSPRKRAAKDGPLQQDTYLPNPIGVGYAPQASDDIVDGMPLPSTEDFHDRVTTPTGAYRPLAFGPIGRHWAPRQRYAGTYDAAWREEVFPFLPADFDDAFFQCAPSDQQMDFPQGGEPVALHNLVPGQPIVTFELPKPDLLLKVLYTSQVAQELTPVVDTVFIEPDKGIFTYVYRASIALPKRGVFGVRIVAAGPVCKKWWTAQVLGTQDCGCNGEGSELGPDDPDEDEASPTDLLAQDEPEPTR